MERPRRKATVSHFLSESLGRIPYATCISFIMSLAGVVVFYYSMWRGSQYTLHFLKDSSILVDAANLIDQIMRNALISILVIMIVWGLFIVILSIFATGATRESLYKGWAARLSGKVACAVFILITYILAIFWVALFGLASCSIFIHSALTFGVCKLPQGEDDDSGVTQCVDLRGVKDILTGIFGDISDSDLFSCNEKYKNICKDYFEPAERMYIIATVATFVVVFSMFQYLMCLSANYSHIKDVKSSSSKISPSDSDNTLMMDASPNIYSHYRRGNPTK